MATSTMAKMKDGMVWKNSRDAHQHVVDDAAVEAGDGADQHAERDRGQRGDNADQQRVRAPWK